jgi:DNA-binding SARP family transcriptional activator
MEFQLLGALEVRRDGLNVPLGGARRQAVLAMLALRTNDSVSIDELTDAVWTRAPASPASNLRTFIMELRRSLANSGENVPRLMTRSSGYVLATWPGEVDVKVFEEEARRGAQAMRQRDLAAAAGCFECALEAWHGEPLAGLDVGPALRAEVGRLVELRLAVAVQRAQVRLDLGDYGVAVGELRQLTVQHPAHEGLWAALMSALYRSGRKADALAAYQEARHLLIGELGLEPGSELCRLHHEILTGGFPARGTSLVSDGLY